MEIEKFTDKQVRNILNHMSRINPNDTNADIDSGRTELNYSLTPYIDVSRKDYQSSMQTRAGVKKSEWEYYKLRKSELYCYGREDVCTLAGCVITLPAELVGYPDKAEKFFVAVAQFLCDRYGGEATEDGRAYPNVVSITVHYDEKQLDEAAGLRGHLHFNWIPAVKIDHEKLMSKKNHVKLMEVYDYKISAKECINKKDLSTLHQDLAAYLVANNVEGKVVVNSNGGGRNVNIPVAHLKEYTERTGKTIDKELLKNLTVERIVEGLEMVREKEQGHLWGPSWEDRDWEFDNTWTR